MLERKKPVSEISMYTIVGKLEALHNIHGDFCIFKKDLLDLCGRFDLGAIAEVLRSSKNNLLIVQMAEERFSVFGRKLVDFKQLPNRILNNIIPQRKTVREE